MSEVSQMENREKMFSFGFPEIAHAIVNGLQMALENVMPDIMSDYNLPTRNGYGQFRWNPIITQVQDKCQHLGWVETGICTRGAWKLPVLFHLKSGYIFTLMTEDTFRDVQRRKDKGKHYLSGASSLNLNVKPQYEQLELNLPGVAANAQKWVAKSREQLAQAIRTDVGEIQGHILVLFDDDSDKLLTVRAVRLTPSLEISTEEENWSQFIGKPFSANQRVEPQQTIDDEEDLVVLL